MRRAIRMAAATALSLVLALSYGGVAGAASPALTPIDITTLPAIPGYVVTLDGHQARTDAHGVAHFMIAGPTVRLSKRVVVTKQELVIDGVPQRVEPARFYKPNTRRIIVFNVFYLVRFRFKNSNGGPLDASTIKTVTVKNSIGESAVLPAHKASWLQGSRVVPLQGELAVKKIYWTVQDVQYAGSNVVNSSQQRFQPADIQDVTISLLFFRAQLRVHDALFGFRRGGTIVLVYPDKTRRRFRLSSDGAVTLPSLPRGNYAVVIDGLGPRLTQDVAISTNQDLDLKYYSWIDIAVLALLGLLFSVGLLVLGLRRRQRARRRSSVPDEDETELEPLTT